MGKSKRNLLPGEDYLHTPAHPSFKTPAGDSSATICDTHTHLLSTFASYRLKYPSDGKYATVFDFARGIYCSNTPPPSNGSPSAEGSPPEFARHQVDSIIDVYCEAPVRKEWKELADSASTLEGRQTHWGGIEYWFVLGVHPHEAREYNDSVEADILEAMKHPRCVGWGEIGLDFHYMNSPREVQKDVLKRQLRHAVRLGKPLTIHTREADEDIESILKAEVPRDHKIHVHCFTDSPTLASNLLSHFPNLYIGVTGVITYSTNQNTSTVIRELVAPTPDAPQTNSASPLRIVLETDAPFMTPSNLTSQVLGLKSGQKLPFSHSAMIPWTAEFVANVAGEGWNTNKVLEIARENARRLYGV